MAVQWKSMLGGAGVAALLIIPAAADNNGGWITWPWRSYQVNDVKIDSVVGHLRVEVKPQAQVGVQVSGRKARLDHITVRQSGNTLIIEGENRNSVWDWSNWFDFSSHENSTKDVDVHVVVPKGTALDVEDMVGDAAIGDTEGDLHFEAVDSNATIGHVREAHLDMAGAGKIDVARIDGDLHLSVAGSGRIRTGSARAVHADIAGSGTASLGQIRELHLDIAGSGDFSAQRVDGPVKVDIMGAGSVNIKDGVADPLHLDIAGAGNFVFGGEAVDPHISAFGSGSVKLRSYRGKLSTDGMADVKIGPDGFPAAPAAPPAPPVKPK